MCGPHPLSSGTIHWADRPPPDAQVVSRHLSVPMLDETTNWPRLYSTAALLGAAFGLLLSIGALPSAPEWPAAWGLEVRNPIGAILLPVIGGALVGLVLAAAAHLGTRYQLRRRSKSGTG